MKERKAAAATGKSPTKAAAPRVRRSALPTPEPPSIPRRKAIPRDAGALLLALALGFSGTRVVAADVPPKVSVKEIGILRKAAGQGYTEQG